MEELNADHPNMVIICAYGFLWVHSWSTERLLSVLPNHFSSVQKFPMGVELRYSPTYCLDRVL